MSQPRHLQEETKGKKGRRQSGNLSLSTGPGLVWTSRPFERTNDASFHFNPHPATATSQYHTHSATRRLGLEPDRPPMHLILMFEKHDQISFWTPISTLARVVRLLLM